MNIIKRNIILNGQTISIIIKERVVDTSLQPSFALQSTQLYESIQQQLEPQPVQISTPQTAVTTIEENIISINNIPITTDLPINDQVLVYDNTTQMFIWKNITQPIIDITDSRYTSIINILKDNETSFSTDYLKTKLLHMALRVDGGEGIQWNDYTVRPTIPYYGIHVGFPEVFGSSGYTYPNAVIGGMRFTMHNASGRGWIFTKMGYAFDEPTYTPVACITNNGDLYITGAANIHSSCYVFGNLLVNGGGYFYNSATTTTFEGAVILCGYTNLNYGATDPAKSLWLSDTNSSQNGYVLTYTNNDHTATTGRLVLTSTAHTHSEIADIQIGFDGGGAVLTAGKQIDVFASKNMSITGWEVLADGSGTVGIGIWKDIRANYPPTAADSVFTASTISAAISGATLGSPMVVTAGDCIRFNINTTPAPDIVTRITVVLTGVTT